MFTTPRLRDSISIALTKLLQRGRRGSHYIQVCKKGSRQSEQQRSDIQLRNLAFCVWEDASLWARCIHSFLMHFSYLGQSCFLVHLAPCILPTPQMAEDAAIPPAPQVIAEELEECEKHGEQGNVIRPR